MIKNIIFDLGQVLLTYAPKPFLQSHDALKSHEDFLYQSIFRNPLWLELDKGTKTVDEVISIVSNEHPERSEEIHFCLKNFHSMFQVIPSTENILYQLKEQGYNLYILSNFHEDAFDYVSNKYDFFKAFHGGVVSAHVKQLKPEKNIYDTLLQKYNLAADECLFIDDTLENIVGAKDLGIHGIHLKKPEILKDELLRFDIAV